MPAERTVSALGKGLDTDGTRSHATVRTLEKTQNYPRIVLLPFLP